MNGARETLPRIIHGDSGPFDKIRNTIIVERQNRRGVGRAHLVPCGVVV